MSSADVILQSADHVNFRVHKSVLVASSPFFADMFSLPQPQNDEAIDGLPVVHLSEDAEVLNSLISMLYPVSHEIPDTNDNILSLISACQKYDMDVVQSSIRAEVSHRGLLSPKGVEAFRVHAVACQKRLRPEMETTARLTLDYPLTFEYLGEALRSFEGRALRDLVEFHQDYSDRLNSAIQRLSDYQTGPSRIWVGCPGPVLPFSSQPENNPAPSVWLLYLLGRIKPQSTMWTINPSSFRKEYSRILRDHVNDKDCHFCMKVHTLHGEAFCAQVERDMLSAKNGQYPVTVVDTFRNFLFQQLPPTRHIQVPAGDDS
jgi:BTB/POZ domain